MGSSDAPLSIHGRSKQKRKMGRGIQGNLIAFFLRLSPLILVVGSLVVEVSTEDGPAKLLALKRVYGRSDRGNDENETRYLSRIRQMRKYQKRLMSCRAAMGMKIWYFIAGGMNFPVSGSHTLESCLYIRRVRGLANPKRKMYARYEIELEPDRP